MNEDESTDFETSPSFFPGLAPKEEDVQFTLGPYQVIRSIGKGGMGEVLLAYDTKCGRRVALKKIRPDLLEHQALHERFLKEARMTSQLTHPAIMPIYAIEDVNAVVYYTMPFVQGETLKQILRITREQEKKGEALHHIGGSIPALIRIFITVCHAVAYAHSKGVLHRDLKPENVIVGDYGEVLILDWGLAKLISEKEESSSEISLPSSDITRAGKVVGTLNFMAKERVLGKPANVQTEIYSLGVTLYQLLTLRNPFHRGTLEEFRKKMKGETLEDPVKVAPYRDVPRVLSHICMKCLADEPNERYSTVNELLHELESYVEGRSEWYQIADLNLKRKADWEFQENVLIAEHIAITHEPQIADWVSLMISKASFAENTKITANVRVGDSGFGVGFLMSIPEAAERVHLNDGYCLWLGSDINRSTKLLRSTVEVIDAPEIFLERGREYEVRIEKIDHNIYFYLNHVLQFSYISHLPLVGTHVGILSRDDDFILENFTVYVGSQNITVNCLAVPDAFLAHRDYATALSEYRRIGYSFPGRAEGREAMFRAGITLLEEAKVTQDLGKKEKLYDEAFSEFEKLHPTPGAPLEYLGKAHIYQANKDVEEEIKCYELGLRKYPKHPLLSVLHEQLIFRMHETSHIHRRATYLFMLTALRHLPMATESLYTKKLFNSVQSHWEPLSFLDKTSEKTLMDSTKNRLYRIHLAFWLAKPHALAEVFDEVRRKQEVSIALLSNTLFCLIELGAWKLANEKLKELSPKLRQHPCVQLLEIGILCHQETVQHAFAAFCAMRRSLLKKDEIRLIMYLIERSLQHGQVTLVHNLLNAIKPCEVTEDIQLQCDSYQIWALLLEKEWDQAKSLLHAYPLSALTKDSSLLFILYGCWLAATETEEIAAVHFCGVLDVSFPRSWTLLSHFLNKKITLEGKWGQQAFLWEKRQLYRQLALYAHCRQDVPMASHYKKLELKEYVTGNG